jgi:hypothetical protein
MTWHIILMFFLNIFLKSETDGRGIFSYNVVDFVVVVFCNNFVLEWFIAHMCDKYIHVYQSKM